MKNLFIAGEWLSGDGELEQSERFLQQSHGTPTLWRGTSNKQLKTAIDFAERSDWSTCLFDTRVGIIKTFQLLLQKHKEELANLLRQEIGKPLWESKQEVESTIQKIEHTLNSYSQRLPPCEWQRQDLTGAYIHGMTTYRPHGISAVIGPFNLPLHLPNGQILPALLAGNSILFKPSEYAPKISKRYVELLSQSGLPAGALQLLQGGKTVAEAICQDERVRAIFFTGSYQAGQAIAATSTSFPFRLVALEMGGNNPMIITPSGQRPETIPAIIASTFITAGQRCTCARRMILVEPVNQSFLHELVSRARRLTVGIPKETFDPFMGPLIRPEAVDKVERQINSIPTSALLPLTRPDKALLTPAILEVTNFPDEEIFGPVLLVKRVSSLEEAIQVANQSEYGLSAALFSQHAAEWHQFSRKIQAGVIAWNSPTTGASGKAPFGGIGKSGNFHPVGWFAIDSCVYPVASTISPFGTVPSVLPKEFYI